MRRRGGGVAPAGRCRWAALSCPPTDICRSALLAALSAGGGLLGFVTAAAAARALAAAAAALRFASSFRGAGRVRDRRRARLAHALFPQAFVLLVVLDAGTVVFGHPRRSFLRVNTRHTRLPGGRTSSDNAGR